MEKNYMHQVKGIVMLDLETGKRLFAKYYTNETAFSTLVKQHQFEKSLFSKTQKIQAFVEPEVVLADKYTCVFHSEVDLLIYIIGDQEENEIVLSEVLTCLISSLHAIFRNQLEKRTLLENFDLILLSIDELIDDGVIMEVDANNLMQKVLQAESNTLMKGFEDDAISQVVMSAKDQFFEKTKQVASSLFSFN